ncbi:MAG: hypothetical protein AB8I80_01415, partial [Anaerolineae bacterium]
MTQVISSVPALKVPCMWGSETLATEVSMTSISVPIITVPATTNLLGSARPLASRSAISALQDPAYSFDPYKNIRFRSSTNVEDSAQFTGAGLYDSFSGCLADDLDGDELGPSICDP